MSRKQSSSAPAASYAIAAATGSPASRRSTNLTPLTTRPSLTSRQGMTRTLNMAQFIALHSARGADQPQSFAGVKASVVEGAAGDCAGELFGTRCEQRPDVRDGG